MSKRNREAGNRFELQMLHKLKAFFPNIVTSRNESRLMDGKKVDFCNTDGFNFQCKLQMKYPDLKILDEMPDGKNVIIWGKTVKANKNIMQKDTYCIIKFDELLKLLS